MKLWAHRGCSQIYPENTLTSFRKAADLHSSGLTGIELDIQMTKDGEIVVIHDERIDRTTDGFGFVKDYTLEELKTFHIHTGQAEPEYIPTIQEVLDLLMHRLQKGLLLNIELKNGIFRYPGMIEKVVSIVRERSLEESIVWSSFFANSLEEVRRMLPDAEIGVLDNKASDCIYKLKGGCGANAIHPYWKEIDVSLERLRDALGFTMAKRLNPEHQKELAVRAWFTGHLYPEKPTGGHLDLVELEEAGITDVFLNEPEVYL